MSVSGLYIPTSISRFVEVLNPQKIGSANRNLQKRLDPQIALFAEGPRI